MFFDRAKTAIQIEEVAARVAAADFAAFCAAGKHSVEEENRLRLKVSRAEAVLRRLQHGQHPAATNDSRHWRYCQLRG